MPIGATIVHDHDLYFDPADADNGSLYLCVSPGTPNGAIEPIIELLRNAALWSREPYKTVPEGHKQNYAEQMQFIACAQFKLGPVTFVAARYNHPKFPSSSTRWDAWLTALNSRCG